MKNYLIATGLCIFVFVSCKKEKDTVVPELSITGTQVYEGNTGTTKAIVNFALTGIAKSEVSFTVSTADGTAKAGEDYIAVTSIPVTIQAGQYTAKVEVAVNSDTNFDFNRTFQVKAENVKNATLKYASALVTIMDDDSYTPTTDADGVITPDSYPGMTLVWSDEFNGTHLNTDFWKYEKGAGGWGNNELEEYTDSPDNVFVENGLLNIKAIQNGTSYTSGRIITSGKKEFKFGRIDIRAKLPYGKGVWPALWMLGSNISTVSWPACGEIDIMELLGQEPAKVYGTAHYDEAGHKYEGSSYSLTSGNFSEKFHVFTLMWQENSMVWYIDYQKFFQFSKAQTTFRNNFFFIMNVAVGGNWPGNPDNTTIFPQSMVVDYIRVFQ